MTSYTWSSTASGSWGNAANWTPNALPTDLDTVSIGVAGITVSVTAGVSAAAYTLNTSNSGFLISGGTLITEHLATFNGAFSQTGGIYTAGGQGAVFNGATNLAGNIHATSGALVLNSSSNLSGTFSGAGVLEFANGGVSYINSGFACGMSILVTGGARVGFNTSFSDTHNITVTNSVLDLFGNTLFNHATMQFTGTIGYGLVQDAGTLTLGATNGIATLDNGLVVNVTGTLIQSNTVNLGANDSGAKINIAKTGHYDINGNWNTYDPSSVGSISNVGVLAKTGGGKLATINASLTSSGTLNAAIGELQLAGLINTLSGTASGAGTLGIAGFGQTTLAPKMVLSVASVHQQSGILVLNAAQNYAGAWNMSGGVLNLNSHAAVLNLTGRGSFDSGTITGYGGTLELSGTAELGNVTIGGPDTIAVNGTLNQISTIQFGDSSNPTVNIAASASWLLDADSSIYGLYGVINNAGVFHDRNGSNVAMIQSEFVNTGTLIADSGLQLTNNVTLGGTLTGYGLLDLAGTTTLLAGTSITVAALDVSSATTLGGNLSDGGIFSQIAGTLDTGSFTLALSGTVSLDGGAATDTGVLGSSGHLRLGSYNVGGGAELLVTGTADQVNDVYLSTASGAGTLVVAAGAVYTGQDDVSLYGAGALFVGGQLTEDGTGLANVTDSVTVQGGGVLTANDQTLTLSGGGTFAGTLAGTGRFNLNGGTFALASGFSALSAGLEVSGSATALLQANQSYAGDFITSGRAFINLGTDTLSLTGTAVLADNAVLTGSGVLLASASATLGAVTVEGNATLTVSGATQQLGSLQVGDPAGSASTADFAIAAGGTDSLAAGASIGGDGTLTVAGTLVAGSHGLSQLSTSIIDTGVISANLGTLQVQGAVTPSSTGMFTIGAAGTLEFSTTSTIGLGTGVDFLGAGTLHVDNLKTFAATIENFAANDTIQLAGLNAASLSGTYANTAHTNLLVSDGQGGQIVLAFSTAQTLSAITFGAGVNGIATLTHH